MEFAKIKYLTREPRERAPHIKTAQKKKIDAGVDEGEGTRMRVLTDESLVLYEFPRMSLLMGQ